MKKQNLSDTIKYLISNYGKDIYKNPNFYNFILDLCSFESQAHRFILKRIIDDGYARKYLNMSSQEVLKVESVKDTSVIQNKYGFNMDLIEYCLQSLLNGIILNLPIKESGIKSQTVIGKSDYIPENRDVVSIEINEVKFNMILVKGGAYKKELKSYNRNGYYMSQDEKSIDDFYIGETVVTQALWKAVMENNPSTYKGRNLPVVEVSWNQCEDFIYELNRITGNTFRLLRESEWEYAAKEGYKNESLNFYSPSFDEIAWHKRNSSNRIHEVAGKKPNSLGIYDMLGNVWEWCDDNYDSNTYKKMTGHLYKGVKKGNYKIRKGGSNQDGLACSITYCGLDDPLTQSVNLGFRLAADVDKCISLKIDNKTTKQVEKDILIDFHGMDIKMIFVRGGDFLMGATEEQEIYADKDEKPCHKVRLDNYYLCETVVTQALWRSVMGHNPSKYFDSEMPVVNVSWHDCKNFIRKLNSLTGKQFRLPTEAEWEYAARGGCKSKGYRYAGSNKLEDVAWFWRNSGTKYISLPNENNIKSIQNENRCTPHRVCLKKPNELGFYDMSGNVWEWCVDTPRHYNSLAQVNPIGSALSFYRIKRGGSFCSTNAFCRVSSRDFDDNYTKMDNIGLRLAMSFNK